MANEFNEASVETMSLKTPVELPRRKLGVVFLGDEAVGKTSILTRYAYDHFESNYIVTVGVDFVSKSIKKNNWITRLQIWDTAGQERFRSLTPSYIRLAAIAIVVYDVTNKESFANVEEWISQIKNERGEEVPIVLVGNKIDLTEERQVSIVDGERLALKYKISYFETSAKTGENINKMFETIITIMENKKGLICFKNRQRSIKMIDLEKTTKQRQTKDDESNKNSFWCCFDWLF